MQINPNSPEGKAEFKRLILSNGTDLIFMLSVIREEYKESIFSNENKSERDKIFWKVSNLDEIILNLENEVSKTKAPTINI